jgi:hypothetical protein
LIFAGVGSRYSVSAELAEAVDASLGVVASVYTSIFGESGGSGGGDGDGGGGASAAPAPQAVPAAVATAVTSNSGGSSSGSSDAESESSEGSSEGSSGSSDSDEDNGDLKRRVREELATAMPGDGPTMSDSEDSSLAGTNSLSVQGTTLTGVCYNKSQEQSQLWLKRGVLAARLGLEHQALAALDHANSFAFSLHAWMAKLQLLCMRGFTKGFQPYQDVCDEAMEALCRISVFLEEFNEYAVADQSDSYLRKMFFILVAHYGLMKIRVCVSKLRARAKRNAKSRKVNGKGSKFFLDGAEVRLAGLIQELVHSALRWKTFGYDR